MGLVGLVGLVGCVGWVCWFLNSLVSLPPTNIEFVGGHPEDRFLAGTPCQVPCWW